MKALTVQQPWAWAIIHGGKTIENRSWQTHYRGLLAIHAGKGRQWLANEDRDDWLDLYGVTWPAEDDPAGGLVFGAVLGVVELVDCVPFDELSDQERIPWATGLWCWVLEKPMALERPLICSGKQLLWEVKVDLPVR